MGLLGFLQITVDAGAFLNAHQNVIGVNDTLGPADATHQVFPQIQTAAITNVVMTAPTPIVPVDYGYNDANPTTVAASANNRHGGASIMQPYLSQTTITETPFTFLRQAFRVHSQATEAEWLDSLPEWDVANSNYGAAYAPGNTQANTSMFTQGENNPLFYMSFNYVRHCETPGSWGNPSGSRGICPTSDILAMGSGEYLDTYNWSNGTAGVGGAANATGPGGATGTFEAAACHQRMYSTLAYFFENLAENNYGNSAAFAGDPLNYLETTYNPYYYNRSGYTNFANASFFGQEANGGSLTGLDRAANSAIGTIYGWDVERGSNGDGLGGIGQNPLHPTTGCV
jgi:hypothetical protein